MAFLNLGSNGVDLGFFVEINDVVIVLADDLFGRCNADDVEFVYVVASMAWWRPSDLRRPCILRPVKSSIMTTFPFSMT